MSELYAIKRTDDWFWKTDLTFEELQKRIHENQINYDWLVCPQGASDRAITIREFLHDPRIFHQQELEIASRERARGKPENTPLTKLGLNLLGVCFLCLAIGRVVVMIVFPGPRNEMPLPLLIVLIPIWTIGAIGLVVYLVGLILWKFRK